MATLRSFRAKPAPPAQPSLVVQTLLTLARQRDGLSEPRCRTLLDLMETSGLVGVRIRGELARDGLTRIKFAVLLALFAIDPVAASPSDLALHTGASRPAVSTALDGLTRRRLVSRAAGDPDRRVRYVTLTAAGRELIDRAATRCLRLLGRIAQLLPASAHSQLRLACALLQEGAAQCAELDALTSPVSP